MAAVPFLLRQYRTKSVWRLCTPSACKFPVIFHKNAREYIQYSLRFLFHLTKNLTTHLSHNLCAVLPKKIFPQGAPRGNISIYSNISKSVSTCEDLQSAQKFRPGGLQAGTLFCTVAEQFKEIGRIYAAVAVNVSRKQFLAGQRALVSGTDICRVL